MELMQFAFFFPAFFLPAILVGKAFDAIKWEMQ